MGCVVRDGIWCQAGFRFLFLLGRGSCLCMCEGKGKGAANSTLVRPLDIVHTCVNGAGGGG